MLTVNGLGNIIEEDEPFMRIDAKEVTERYNDLLSTYCTLQEKYSDLKIITEKETKEYNKLLWSYSELQEKFSDLTKKYCRLKKEN